MRLIISLENENVANRLSHYLQSHGIENVLEKTFDKEKQKDVFDIWATNEDFLTKAKELLNNFLNDPANTMSDSTSSNPTLENSSSSFDNSTNSLENNSDSFKDTSDSLENTQDNPAADVSSKSLDSNIPTDNIKYDSKSSESKDNSNTKKPYELPKTTTSQKPFVYKLTFFFLITCILIYLLGIFQWAKMQKKYNFEQQVMFTPIQMLFLYDLPQARIMLDDVIIKYDLKSEKDILDPPEDAKEEMEKIDNIPTWTGLYEIFISRIKPNNSASTQPTTHSYVLFEKIRQGQVWRLFTPILLHGGFLHILFNMIWFWYLSKQMEPKLKAFRYLLFIIITAVVSNTCQYIMGGPFFLGLSGVITAMVGYIFVRQRVAPWEGYNVPDAIFYFIGIFILAMLALQIVSFFFQIFHSKQTFAIGIANTAHITGALIGMALAKIPYFRRSHE